MPNHRLPTLCLMLVLVLSGFAGLGYETVWARMLAVGLGHEMPAVLAVVCAFFSGMALGAWALDRPIRSAASPMHWYAGLEAAAGVWAACLIFTIPVANRWITLLIGVTPSPLRHWSVVFGATFLLLLPATAAMGATLPAMERSLAGVGNGRNVGRLYAANTLGAVVGTVAATFWMVPQFGLRSTAGALAAIHLLCACSLFAAFRASRPAARSPSRSAVTGIPGGRLLFALWFTGLLGIGFEVLTIRALGQVLENTVYSFSTALAVYLLGTAVGAALYQAWDRRKGPPAFSRLLTLLSLACLASSAVLCFSTPLYRAVHEALGTGMWAAHAGEAVLAASVLLLPAAAMGATFSHLAQSVASSRGSMGKALALNTLGGAAAPLLFGPILLPVAGLKPLLIAVSAAYMALLPPGARRNLWGPAAAVVLLAALPLEPGGSPLLAGEERVAYAEGVMASVSVVKDQRGDHHLTVNHRLQMGGTGSVYSDHRQAHIPLLLHPAPRRALFLGLGTGATVSAAASHPGLEADAVELIPEILPLLPHFEKANGYSSGKFRATIHVADARRFVQARGRRYDVVVGDLFHPARDGAAALYTVEHFSAVRDRLAKEGIFCQWLPLYQLDAATFRTIIRSFRIVFPDAAAFLNHFSVDQPIVGLIGAGSPLRYPPEWYDQRVKSPELRRSLEALGLHDFLAVFGGYLADGRALAAYAGEGPINTDDRPTVLFSAPSVVYGPEASPHHLLLDLLRNLQPRTDALINPADNPQAEEAHRRLSAYWTARNRFIEAGVAVRRTADARELLDQVREPLLRVVRLSPDFDPAYRPLLAMAAALHPKRPQDARQLLRELAEASPHRPEALRLLERFAASQAGDG